MAKNGEIFDSEKSKDSKYKRSPHRVLIKTANSKASAFLTKALNADAELSNIKWLSKLNKKDIGTDYKAVNIRKTDALAEQVSWKRGIYSIPSDEGIDVIQVIDVVPPQLRSFEDSKGFVIAQYQEYLEEQWMTDLREQYTIVLNDTVLQSIIKE